MSACDAAIRPFPNDTEVRCDFDHANWAQDATDGALPMHKGTLRDYAYPGSATVISWDELDRRNFHGGWPGPCPRIGCILPAGHRGDDAW